MLIHILFKILVKNKPKDVITYLLLILKKNSTSTTLTIIKLYVSKIKLLLISPIYIINLYLSLINT